MAASTSTQSHQRELGDVGSMDAASGLALAFDFFDLAVAGGSAPGGCDECAARALATDAGSGGGGGKSDKPTLASNTSGGGGRELCEAGRSGSSAANGVERSGRSSVTQFSTR